MWIRNVLRDYALVGLLDFEVAAEDFNASAAGAGSRFLDSVWGVALYL